MSARRIGTREEWREARLELLEAEKELTRRSDELARRRAELPWVPVEETYHFEGADGPLSLQDLFAGRSQLIAHHVMFPGCPSCASFVDGLDAAAAHLAGYDVPLAWVCRSPLRELSAFRERMGWPIPFYS